MGRVFRLPRRTFLRGAGGVALALPALEIMAPSRAARAGGGASPKFMTSFVGTSIGRNHWPDDDCCGPTYPGDQLTPDNEGAGYDLKHVLSPVGADPWQYHSGFGGNQPAFDVQKELTVVSGLKVPWGPDGDLPPGGRTIKFHYCTVTPQISGTICSDYSEAPHGPTIDQMVVDAIGGGRPALAYRVEAKAAGGNTSAMSWKSNGSGGVSRVDPVVNPRLAWESLFTGFVPPDPAQAAAAAFEIAQRRSVLDLVSGSAERLVARLGHADKIRMEQHLDELRALENKVNGVMPGSAQCEMLTDPGGSWPVTPENGWSNEELRAEVLSDLIHMAFVCDLTNAASLMFGQWKCYLKMGPAIGWDNDLHGYSHFGGSQTGIAPLSDAIAWHIKHFARLIRKCMDTQDVDGVPLIDHTILTMIFEGNVGYDPEADAVGVHSTENMVVLVAGGRGLGLNPGRHIKTDEVHPAAVLLGAAQACGVTDPLGDIDEAFTGL